MTHKQIARLRHMLGLSQETVARRVGTWQPVISLIERDPEFARDARKLALRDAVIAVLQAEEHHQQEEESAIGQVA